MSSEIKMTDQSMICKVNSNNLIETLQQEENKLLVKLQKASDENNFSDYKMLIRNLTEVTKLKQQEMITCKYNKKVIHSMYIDVSRDKEQPTVIFYKGRIYHLYDVKLNDIIQYIKDITKGDDFEVYLELNDNCSMALADYLKAENIEVKATIVENNKNNTSNIAVKVKISDPIITDTEIKIPMFINNDETKYIVGKRIDNKYVFNNGDTISLK